MIEHFKKHPFPSSYIEERLKENRVLAEHYNRVVAELEEHLRWAYIFEAEEKK